MLLQMNYRNEPAHLSASRKLLQPVRDGNKQPAVIGQITRLARNLGAGAKLPTFREFCAFLEITPTTLERCLRRLEEQDVVLRRNRSGLYVSPAIGQKSIGVVFSAQLFSHEHAFFSKLLDCCAQRAEAQSTRFSFFVNSPVGGGDHPMHRDLSDAVRDGRVDGLIDLSVSADLYAWLQTLTIPVVGFGNLLWPHRVMLDSNEALAQCMQEFVRLGCRDVGLIGIAGKSAPFVEAAAAAGLVTGPERIVCIGGPDGPAGSIEQLGRFAAQKILSDESGEASKGRRVPSALIIVADGLARGALPVLQAAGLGIGSEVHIAVNTNKGLPSLIEWEDELIRCEFDPAEIADALLCLTDTLARGESPASDIVSIPSRFHRARSQS